MSDMNFLERLLDGVAVEWRMLEDIVSFRRGSFPQPYGNSEWYDGEGSLPFVQVVDVLDGKFELKENTKQRISKLAQPKSVFVEEGTVIVTLQGTIGRVAVTQYDCYVDRTLAIFTNYISGINKKYFAYQLKSKFDIEKENARGSTLKTITKEEFSKFEIPIPCPDNPDRSLAIQAEIVRILDTFTALTAELTAELSDRQKQYNYYRDRLLTFGDEIPVMQLSQCCVTIADGDHQAPPQTNTGIPFITISNVSNSYQIDFTNTKFVSEAYYSELDDKRKARKNDILYTVVGSFGIPVFINENKKFTFQRHIAILRPNGNVIIPKYLYHVLRSSDFLKQAHVVAVGAAQKTITLTALNRMKVPVPPLAEQARIVAILDKFDTLTHSISEGLPREIALRHKQYEHYRDLLLSFPPPLTPP